MKNIYGNSVDNTCYNTKDVVTIKCPDQCTECICFFFTFNAWREYKTYFRGRDKPKNIRNPQDAEKAGFNCLFVQKVKE